ncbi:hypothetical protein OY671_009593, partial [Metschnikowia pulcherrima]
RFSKDDSDTLRATTQLSTVIGRKVKLRRAGSESVGSCPFHDENTPSFRVNDNKGSFHCFGCGAGGDVIKFLMSAEGMTFPDAVRSSLSDSDSPVSPPRDDAAIARKISAERAAAIEDARREWSSARSVRGTPAEIYSHSRGITGP